MRLKSVKILSGTIFNQSSQKWGIHLYTDKFLSRFVLPEDLQEALSKCRILVYPESIEEHFYRCPALRDCLVSEEMVDGAPVIAIDILPVPQAFEGKSDEEIYAFFKKLVDDVNATLPTTHRVAKMTVRKEDFKRTGSLKVSRNQK